jgi:hypothetical protein
LHGGGRGFESHILHVEIHDVNFIGSLLCKLHAVQRTVSFFENKKIVGARSIDFGLRYAKSFMMKLVRAHGGCLGIRRR